MGLNVFLIKDKQARSILPQIEQKRAWKTCYVEFEDIQKTISEWKRGQHTPTRQPVLSTETIGSTLLT